MKTCLALLTATAAAFLAVAAPTLGQTAGPANSGAQGAPAIPDFSGTWAHPFLGFEPPPSGPGPVLNKPRDRQVLDVDGRPIPRGTIAPLISSRFRFVGDYTNPILQPWAAETVKKHGEIELGGVTSPTPNNQCWPEPVPYIFRNLAMQMLQQPERITIIYYDGDQVRRARMNERHPAKVTPSWYGDSVGHYDGDTLVIDTIGVQPNRPFAMVDWYGTPYTEALHVVERYRLIDHEATRDSLQLAGKELFRFGRNVGDTGLTIDPTNNEKALQLQFTVEDEGALTMPWSATITYLRAPATAWPEYICAENLRATYVTKESAVPRADQPDF